MGADSTTSSSGHDFGDGAIGIQELHQSHLRSQAEVVTKKLKLLRASGQLPTDLLDFVGAVVSAQLEAEEKVGQTFPDSQLMQAAEQVGLDRHLQGVPLINREALPYDLQIAESLFERLLVIAENGPEGLRQAAQMVRNLVATSEIKFSELLHRALVGDEAFFAQAESLTPTAPKMLSFLSQASVAPFVRVHAAAVAQRHDADKIWPHGHCPVCGGMPYISHLREKEGRRYLTCSFCQTEYRAPRIGCPYCGEQQPDKVAVFTLDALPGFRIDACQGCGCYLKAMDLRQQERLSFAALDDLESLLLDLLAVDRGLKRPALSAFGF